MKSPIWILIAGLGCLLTATTGCSRGVGEGPPEIRYGEDVCSRCNMIISEERFAAASVQFDPDGTRRELRFDDFNCLLDHSDSHGTRYVHDHETRAWLLANEAVYVFSNELQTPMASGVAAHRERAAAEQMAKRTSGQVLDLSGVIDRHARGALRVDPRAVKNTRDSG